MKIHEGITDGQINQLISYTLSDPLIIKFTSDIKRFGDRTVFDRWFNQERVIYTLADDSDGLKGIVWFVKKPLPQKEFNQPVNPENYTTSFAIRVYGDARGKKIAEKFMSYSLNLYMIHADWDQQGIWLSVHKDNAAAVKVYNALRFKKISGPFEDGKFLMVWDKFKN